MTAEFEPGTSCRDVIGGALATHLNQHQHVSQISAVPSLKRFQQLQTLRLGINNNLTNTEVRQSISHGIKITNKKLTKTEVRQSNNHAIKITNKNLTNTEVRQSNGRAVKIINKNLTNTEVRQSNSHTLKVTQNSRTQKCASQIITRSKLQTEI